MMTKDNMKDNMKDKAMANMYVRGTGDFVNKNVLACNACVVWLLILALSFGIFAFSMFTGNTASAKNSASTDVSKVVDAVKESVSSFPFADSDSVTSKRRVFGVKVNTLKAYRAYQKTTGSRDSSSEYFFFVAKAKSSSKAKSAMSKLKTYIKNEKSNMENYLSPAGKDIFKSGKVGRSGKWVWVLVIGTPDDNVAAGNAIKDNI